MKSAHLPLAALLATASFAVMPLAARAQSEPEAARPEVAKPLEAAQSDIRAGRYDAAAKDIDKASAAGGRSGYETFLIDQTRGVLAQARGDTDGAIDAFTKLLATGRVPASQKPGIEHAIGALQMKKGDFANAADTLARAQKDGDRDPSLPALIAQAHYEAGDFTRAIAETRALIAQAQKAGQKPSKEQLELLVSAARKGNDDATYNAALEQLAALYPSPALYANLVDGIARKPGAVQRYPLDLGRLRRQFGLLTTAEQYQDLAQQMTSAGFPGEADALIRAGFTAGVLGKPETEARDKRLQAYVDRALAQDEIDLAKSRADAADSHDGKGLVRVGYDLVSQGDASGLDLITQGIAKGNLARPEAAQLLLASAYVTLNRPADALAAFKAVQGDDIARGIAHLWVVSLSGGHA